MRSVRFGRGGVAVGGRGCRGYMRWLKSGGGKQEGQNLEWSCLIGD